MEEYEEIKDYPNYLINRQGKIWSKFYNRELIPSLGKDGYLKISLTKDKKRKTYKIHRLLAIQFIPNPDNLPIIDHIDGNRQNNSFENLNWVNPIENSNNRLKRGGICWNENSWLGRITIFGKRYEKKSINKSVVEEWLEKIKIENKLNL